MGVILTPTASQHICDMGIIFNTHIIYGRHNKVRFNTHTGIFLGTWAHQNTDSTNIRTGNYLDTRTH